MDTNVAELIWASPSGRERAVLQGGDVLMVSVQRIGSEGWHEIVSVPTERGPHGLLEVDDQYWAALQAAALAVGAVE